MEISQTFFLFDLILGGGFGQFQPLIFVFRLDDGRDLFRFRKSDRSFLNFFFQLWNFFGFASHIDQGIRGGFREVEASGAIFKEGLIAHLVVNFMVIQFLKEVQELTFEIFVVL